MYNHLSAAPTPPMGFNTWDCYGAAVNEEQFLNMARVQRDRLLPYGWEYAVIDIQWFEPTADSGNYHPFAELTMDGYSRLLPAENRFPSAKGGKGFKPIADEIHAMGMKFGIHILRGIPRQAVHRNTPTVTPGVTARDIASPYSVCPWNTDMYGVNPDARGAQEYYDSLFQLYAAWGVDFVKVDDIANTEFKPHDPYSARREIEMIAKAIERCGRPMALSLSPGPAPLFAGSHLQRHANMWRMSGDFWDTPEALDRMFDLCEKWYPFVGEGHWPDCDMIPLGVLQINEPQKKYRARKCRLTPAEQQTLIDLWCVFRSPLIFGGELTRLDEETLRLLTNRELLAINQRSTGNRPLIAERDRHVWTCRDGEGRTVYAAFNRGDEPLVFDFDAEEDAPFLTKDLWTGETKKQKTRRIVVSLGPKESKVLRVER